MSGALRERFATPAIYTGERFIDAHNLAIRSIEPADCNPNWAGDATGYTHLRVQVIRRIPTHSNIESRRYARKVFTTYYAVPASMPQPPDLLAVLGTLQADARSIVAYGNFPAWAAAVGPLDLASRKEMKRAYLATKAQTKRLKAFLGERVFADFIYHTDF